MATRCTRTSSAALRRKRVWARQQEASAGIAQAGVAIDLTTGFNSDMGTIHMPPGVTIGGVLLDITAERETAATDPATSQLQFGVLVAQETVLGEVERPLDDPHADWMWWQQISFPAGAAGSLWSTADTLGGPIRIRAKRRAEEIGEHLYLVFQGFDIAPTFNVQVTSSVLLLLP